jgi:hypothetical protein
MAGVRHFCSQKSMRSGLWANRFWNQWASIRRCSIGHFYYPQSTICYFFGVKIFLEDSALRGRIALPVKETRFQEARIQRRTGCFDPQSTIYDLLSSLRPLRLGGEFFFLTS